MEDIKIVTALRPGKLSISNNKRVLFLNQVAFKRYFGNFMSRQYLGLAQFIVFIGEILSTKLKAD